MNEQYLIQKLLLAAKNHLPASVITTCESLNIHGEWELALGVCKYHLQDVQVSDAVTALLAACEMGIGASKEIAGMDKPQIR